MHTYLRQHSPAKANGNLNCEEDSERLWPDCNIEVNEIVRTGLTG